MNQKQVNHSPLYPYEEWSITERSFDVETNLQDETIFALGNGYIGMRGNFEEGYGGPDDTTVQGTYINGFYESEPIHYPEGAYGYAKYSQTMLNVTHAKAIELMIGDEPFQLGSGQLLDYERKLDLRRGLLTRRLDWQSPAGKQVRIVTKRLVSLVHQHLAAISYEVTPLNFTARIKVTSSMDGAVTNQVTMGDPRAGSGFRGQVLLSEHYWSEGTYSAMRQRTKQTKFALQCSTEHQYCGGLNVDVNIEALDQRLNTVFECDAALLQPFRLEKFISYCTSRDVPETELQTFGREVVENARRKGFAALADEQRAFLDHYWSRSDVIIEGDTAVQQSIRFNAFQLLQAAGRDGRTNIGAKGLTGEGYEGHYFWDTETYMLPFFIYTHPDISRRLLEYRYRTLDQARERAAEMSQRGALYPWRTINGEETSAYYPAGTAQAHINADIMYGMKRYMEATEDVEFLLQSGAEMLFETARFWEDLGDYIPSKGNRFCINGVTGPDEYTAVVDNNAFTNLMAKDHLLFAVHIAELLQLQHTDDFQRIADKISLLPSEIDAWRQAAKRMYVPYDEGLGITPQDDGFLSKARWDFAGRPKDKYPLLLHYHPLVIYRHQVLKQADVVLALWLQGSQFTKAEKKRNFDYYEP